MISTANDKRRGIIALLILAGVITILFTPFIGSGGLSFQNILSFNEESTTFKIFWQIRLPRVLVGFVTGSILSLCGMVFQSLFRNPLVCPFTLGISSGASFGAAVYIWLGLAGGHFLGLSGVSGAAFLGAMLSVFLVWSLGGKGQGEAATVKMVLAGIAVSFFLASLIVFIQYVSDYYRSVKITRWVMGGLFVFGYEHLWELLPVTVMGLAAIFYFTPALNLLAVGEEIAVSRGVNAGQTIKILFFVVSLMIGAAVSVCGPIAFVGMIAPHICRLMVGSEHRCLTWASFLFGGIFLVWCDTLARVVIAPAEMPVGIITALLGGPFFLWLLRSQFKA